MTKGAIEQVAAAMEILEDYKKILKAVQQVYLLHQQHEIEGHVELYCQHCTTYYPCETVRLLNAGQA